MRVAVYGGSFNPPHVGHCMVSSWLLWCDIVDQVWLVPTFAHAFTKRLAPFDLRVRMCTALAAELGAGKVVVSEVEESLPRPSFMVNTLRHLSRQHPEHDFRLVVGADVLAQTEAWREWDAIVQHWAPIAVGRQGCPTPLGAIDFPDVSSTQVRALLKDGQDVSRLVPKSVLPFAGVYRRQGATGLA